MPIRDAKKLREWACEYRKKNKEQISKTLRRWHLKDKFGITEEQYQDLLDKQDGVCALCKKPPEAFKRGYSLSVDHCHSEGHIRGLLCFPCNVLVEKGKEFFKQALEYLEAPPKIKR